MTIELTPEQQATIQSHVGSDPYDSASSVIDQALEDFGRKRAFFLRELKPALDAADRGDTKPMDMDALRQKLREKWDAEGLPR